MENRFNDIKQFILDMGAVIIDENQQQELIVVDDEENGIKNLIIDCENPILIIEQHIMKTPSASGNIFKRLLQMNRELIHGAFVLDASGENIIFRDTLQLENIDRNELEASIHSLQLALSEYASEFLSYAKS